MWRKKDGLSIPLHRSICLSSTHEEDAVCTSTFLCEGKADDLELRLMGLADKDNEKVTWKEFVVTRDSKSTPQSDIL